MARPNFMMLDEPSIGLAPLLVEEIFHVIRQINAEDGIPILLVEQNARVALEVAHFAYVMETGRIVLDGPRRPACRKRRYQRILSWIDPTR